MTPFFKNKLYVAILTTIAILVGVFILFFFATTLKARSFDIQDDIAEIYMGDSHVRYAVNDNLLPHSLNVANSSESTYFSYFKLKKILNKDPNVKKVILGFSYHNISGYYDDYTFGRYSNSIAANYFYILPISEQLKMMKGDIKKTLSLLVHVLKSGISSWLNKNTFEGGYDNPYTGVTPVEASMIQRLNLQYDLNGKLQSFSLLNIRYLDKIATLCKENNVRLVLLNTPMYPYYRTRIPQKFVEKYNEIVRSGNFEVLDLTRLEMSDSCYQPDGDLLSVEGALETTKEIIRLKNLLINHHKEQQASQ